MKFLTSSLRWPLALVTLALAGLAFSFQNCSNVKLEEPSIEEEIHVLKGSIELCLDGPYDKDTVESSFVGNLNLVNRDKTVARDSDGDGLSDAEELKYGFNPMKRRTNGRYLDKICLTLSGSNKCDDVIVTCADTPNKLGLNDCDWKVLGLDLLYGHPNQGLDSDKDGIIDLIEIARGLLPNQKDDLDDPDHDLVGNVDELARGSNPLTHDEPFSSRFEVQYSLTKKSANTAACAGELWQMKIDQLPWVTAEKMTDAAGDQVSPQGLSFTRPAASNTGLIYVKLRPRPGETGNSKILIRPLILDADLVNLDGTLDDFVSAGEVEK